MKTLICLLSLALLSNAKPQGYGVVDDLGPVIDESNLLDDVFGGGKNGHGDNNFGVNEPAEPNYGDGGSHVNEVVDTSYEECAYYADQDYKCVPYYNCEDGEIVTDGGGLIDIRNSFAAVLDPASSKCPGYLEVCCRHPDFSTNAPITTTPEPATEPPKPKAYVPQCGRRNFGGVGVRIQNEKYKGSTQFGEWPHMCAVLETLTIGYEEHIDKYVCGASLIAPGVVLTGAHCVAKIPKENIKIRCGEWDTQQEIEPSEHQDRLVENVKIHPQFNPKNLKNDFALLFMEADFVLAPHIDTICLPDNLAGIYSYEQKDCVATGWGKDKFGKLGEYQVIMKQVEMDMVNSTECQRRLRRTRLGENFVLDESFVCAGGEKDRDTCKGDGGGPLVCPLAPSANAGYGDIHVEPKYVQAGIIAWGIDCGVEGNPGVYANVADGLCFIHWATQCQTGVPNYFNITGCENWASQEIDNLNYKINNLQKKLITITNDGSGTLSNLRNLHRRIKRAQKVLNAFEEEQSICIAGSGYGQINQGIVDEDIENDSTEVGGYIETNVSVDNQNNYESVPVIVDQSQSEGVFKPVPVTVEQSQSGGIYQPELVIVDQSQPEGAFKPVPVIVEQSQSGGIYQPEPVIVDQSQPEGVFKPVPVIVDQSQSGGIYQPEPVIVDHSQSGSVFQPGPVIVDQSQFGGIFQPEPVIVNNRPSNGY